MKTIGLIGGTTWVSTRDYYTLFNKMVNEKLGGLYSARCIIYSLNFHNVYTLNDEERYDALKKLILHAANTIEYGGADCLLLGANTLHMHAEFLEERIKIPIIHVGEETAKVIASKNMKKVALLGTRITMEKEFYHKKLAEYNIESIIPDEADRVYLHHSITQEFSKNIFTDEAKQKYTHIIAKMVEQGAEGIILGCTEIPLLLDQKDFDIQLFNTTEIHASAAVNFAIG